MKNTQLNPSSPGPACPACLPPWLGLEGGYATHRPILLSSQPSHGLEPLRDGVLPFHTLKYPDCFHTPACSPALSLETPAYPILWVWFSQHCHRDILLQISPSPTHTSSWTTMMFRNIMFSMHLWLLLLRKHTQKELG